MMRAYLAAVLLLFLLFCLRSCENAGTFVMFIMVFFGTIYLCTRLITDDAKESSVLVPWQSNITPNVPTQEPIITNEPIITVVGPKEPEPIVLNPQPIIVPVEPVTIVDSTPEMIIEPVVVSQEKYLVAEARKLYSASDWKGILHLLETHASEYAAYSVQNRTILYEALSVAYIKTGHDRKGIAFYRKTFLDNRHDYARWRALLDLYRSVDDYEQLLQTAKYQDLYFLKESRNWSPFFTGIFAQADAYEHKGNIEAAINILKLSPLRSDYVGVALLEVFYRLGRLKELQGDKKSALRWYVKTQGVDPVYKDVGICIERLTPDKKMP